MYLEESVLKYDIFNAKPTRIYVEMIVPEFYLQDNAEEIIHVQIIIKKFILKTVIPIAKTFVIFENCQCSYILGTAHNNELNDYYVKDKTYLEGLVKNAGSRE